MSRADSPLLRAAKDATEGRRRLFAMIGPDPLVALIEREMGLRFPDDLDVGQLRAAAENVAYVVRAKPSEYV